MVSVFRWIAAKCTQKNVQFNNLRLMSEMRES